MPGEVKIVGFTEDFFGNYPDAEIDILFDLKKEELDLIEEDAVEYTDDDYDFFSFENLIKEFELIFGKIPTYYYEDDDNNPGMRDGIAEHEERLSKFLEELKLRGKYNAFRISAREKFRDVKFLLPVLVSYIKKILMPRYEVRYGRTNEWKLLKYITDFIKRFGRFCVDIAFPADWGKFKELEMFDGNFEGKVGIMFKNPLSKPSKETIEIIKNQNIQIRPTQSEEEDLLKLIKETIKSLKNQNIEFRQTLAYRAIFAFLYVVMRENLHLNIDDVFGINRNKYYKKRQKELMKEEPMSIERYFRLKGIEGYEAKERHKKLPKVRCCVYIDPSLYNIGFNNEFEKDELFKLYEDSQIEYIGEDEEIEGGAYLTDVINTDKGGKENDLIKKHMKKNLKNILDRCVAEFNNTPEDFEKFFRAAYYTLTEENVEGFCKYFDELFCPENIRSFRFSKDGSELILKFDAQAYYKNIFKILDFNNFVHSTNYIAGAGKTSSYAERIAEIVLIYRIICEKKMLNDMKNEKLNESFSKYSNVNLIEESEDEKEVENKYKKEESEDEKEVKDKENAKIYKAMKKKWSNFNNSVNIEKNKNKENFKIEEDEKEEELEEIDTSSNKLKGFRK